MALFRCVGRTSPSFQALDSPAKNVASSGRAAASGALPWAANAARSWLGGADVMQEAHGIELSQLAA